jgi:hypothetical protein
MSVKHEREFAEELFDLGMLPKDVPRENALTHLWHCAERNVAVRDCLELQRGKLDTPPDEMTMETALKIFKPGLYRHTVSGGLYTVEGLITHHEKRLPMVLYVSHKYGGRSTRPLLGWPGDPDGFFNSVQHHGERWLRFSYVGDLPSDTPITDR